MVDDTSVLAAGQRAPDFTLPYSPEHRLTLSDLRGRPVVLAFYPADWSPVCGDQMVLYSAMKSEFDRYGVQMLGISVDSVWCHRAFAEHRRIQFPLLSDFEPKGEVARAYHAYDRTGGVAERALFVLDDGGVIGWSYRSPMHINPGADGILDALDRLTANREVTA